MEKYVVITMVWLAILCLNQAEGQNRSILLDANNQPGQYIFSPGNVKRNETDEEQDWTTTTLNITNPPYLTNIMPVVWDENQEPGLIVVLTANYFETPHRNTTSFRFKIPESASDDIKSKFRIDTVLLYALVKFDREEQKEYFIPILITDNGVFQPSSEINILHLVIGDVNDNEMNSGESKITVYSYEGQLPYTYIGRVYVDDLDDWDLADKRFMWRTNFDNSKRFALNRDTGVLRMLKDTRGGRYELHFTVTEKSSYFAEHNVSAKVLVTVREISEVAVDNSGSIRFYGTTAEDFVSKTPSLSLAPRELLQNTIAEILHIAKHKVDVFTVLQATPTFVDVRFSVLGDTGYYGPERLNIEIGFYQEKLEQLLGLQIIMVGINECIKEELRYEICKNVLHKSIVPIVVYTNTSSFVGINAFLRAEYSCETPPEINSCLNGGTPLDYKCVCRDGYEGPNCEEIAVGFWGYGYAMYPTISHCHTTRIRLEVSTQRKNGLIMYIGPMIYNPLLPLQDFLALELVNGLPVLYLNYENESIRIVQNKHRYFQGRTFTIEIVLQPEIVEMTVCELSTCLTLDAPKTTNGPLYINAPLQLGGSAVDLGWIGSMFNWSNIPRGEGFTGCLRNLTVNDRTYNLGAPILAQNYDLGCRSMIVVTDPSNKELIFLLSFILCLVLLSILLLAMALRRKLQAGCYDEDMDDFPDPISDDEASGSRGAENVETVIRVPLIDVSEAEPKESNEMTRID